MLAKLRTADHDLKEVLRGSAEAFVVKFIAAGSVFALNVVLARQLGAAEAGLFFLAYTIVFIAASISRIGLDNTFVRFIASHRTTNDWARINGLFRTGLRWTFVTSVAAATVIIFFADTLATRAFDKPAFADVVRVMSLGIPFMAIYTLHAKALQGLKRISRSLIVISVASPGTILALAYVIHPEQAATAGWLFVSGSALTLMLGAYWWFVDSNSYITAAPVDSGEVFRSCIPLLVVIMLSQVVTWSSQILLGGWGSSADVAIFSAAQRTALLTSFALVAVNSIVAPKFAAMHYTQRRKDLRRLAVNATRLLVLLAIWPLAAMLIFPKEILALFGPEFTLGANSLRILAFGQFVNAATGSVGFLLAMTGREQLLRNNVFFAAMASLGIGLMLIRPYGITGAAIATATGVALQHILGVWQVRRVLGFNTLNIWSRSA